MTRKPRLGFLGLGWIGTHRMQAVVDSGCADIVAVADPNQASLQGACEIARRATPVDGIDELFERELDGVVIATPSALHATQAKAALERGLAVFCQKPLGRTAAETREIVSAAGAADRLLAVDLSYRHTRALRSVRHLVQSGELGGVYAAELVFHNAYGPDKPWFFDPVRSGGGCVVDLGIHLVDAALWILGFPAVERVEARLWRRGQPLGATPDVNEDHAIATLHLAGGASARLTCSWNLPAGRDAVIGAAFYGTSGAAEMSNVDGSFFDFVADRHRGTATERLVDPPDAWGGRAIVAWAEQLGRDASFDPAAHELVRVAEVLDAIYGR